MISSKELVLGKFNGNAGNRIPIWFMRQAGRYLPEYREFREGKSFEEMAMNPENIVEITLQPIRRYDLDAAIIFSDILIPLYGMDRGLKIVPQVGPVLKEPLMNPKDIVNLKRTTPEEDFPYLKKSIELVRKEIPGRALFGFAGAPFTLASYLIEGKSTRNALLTKTFAYKYPNEFFSLLDMLSKIVIDQLQAQIDGGADIIQLFDSWAGFLSPTQYEKWVLPHLQKIFSQFKNVPNILYGRGTSHLISVFNKSGARGISLDSSLSLIEARSQIGNDLVIQGNLDPSVLLTSPEIVKRETEVILNNYVETSNPRYIFNLAQGIDKTSKLENVEMMVETVKSFNQEEIK